MSWNTANTFTPVQNWLAIDQITAVRIMTSIDRNKLFLVYPSGNYNVLLHANPVSSDVYNFCVPSTASAGSVSIKDSTGATTIVVLDNSSVRRAVLVFFNNDWILC